MKLNQWNALKTILKPAAIAVCLSFVLSCAPATTAISTQCVTNPDQTSLYKGHWTAHPIPLAVIATDFSSDELNALDAAITTWNNFFTQSKGFKLYLSGSSDYTMVSAGSGRATASTICGQSLVGPGGFGGQIMIYKNLSGWSYGSAVIALTSLCPVVTANSTYRSFTAAMMEINYQNFFTNSNPVPDLQSIVTHELGHVLGLDHSCNGTGCTNAVDDYLQAVMYPTLGFNGRQGIMKRDLNTNDQERANCLY